MFNHCVCGASCRRVVSWSIRLSSTEGDTACTAFSELTFSHPQKGRIDFNTVNPSLPTGMDFLIHPCRWIDDEENVRTPPKRGRYWEIHPRRPRDFRRPKRFPESEAREKSRGSRFSRISSSSIHLQGWIRKSIPVGREELIVLKSILPCWGWEND